jgi:hypothetical protein
MEFMHHLLGEDMIAPNLVAMLLGVVVGVVARLSRGTRRGQTVSGHDQ